MEKIVSVMKNIFGDLFEVDVFFKAVLLLFAFGLMVVFLKIPITFGVYFTFFSLLLLIFFMFSECSNLCKSALLLFSIGAVMGLAVLYYSPIFHTKEYSSLIKVKEINATNVIVSDANKVRKVTKDMALMKANKILGRKINGVEINTQYEIDNGYIVKFKNHQYWVFPLQYSGFVKWLNQDNVPGYIMVSAVNPYDEPIFVEKSYKYDTSSYFTQDVRRIFLIKNNFMPVRIRFEIDENKNPYWIGIGLKYKYFGHVYDVDKIFVMNAKTGEIKTYDINNAPKWIDVLYPEDVINDYIEYYGKYRNGFVNYITGNNVINPTKYDGKELWLVENKLNNNLKWFSGMSSENRKDNSLSSVILVDSKNLNAYIIENVVGIMDEKGAIDAINAKLGVNSIKWTAVLPMAFIKNNKWFWVASIIDKNTYFYQKEGIVDGKNPNYVYFANSLSDIMIESSNKQMKNDGVVTKQKIYNKINKIENELKELKAMLKKL